MKSKFVIIGLYVVVAIVLVWAITHLVQINKTIKATEVAPVTE